MAASEPRTRQILTRVCPPAQLDKYPPGQRGIDGGGWKIQTLRLPEASTGDVAYLYVQFESMLAGYIDDVEFVVGDATAPVVNVRRSSCSGYLDFGVNAKRYNWLAKEVGKKKGWTISTIREKEHPNYFGQNDLTDADL